MYLSHSSPGLEEIMRGDLSFKGTTASHVGHNTHAFAAKFPPQLPHAFISQLTEPGEKVLDPMAGSGTALLEAARLGRQGIGVDIDPLAVRIGAAKTTRLDEHVARAMAESIVDYARLMVASREGDYAADVLNSYDPATRRFVEYWFLPEIIGQLGALTAGVRRFTQGQYRTFFEMLLSSIVITKSGGVTQARDLAHTRPHKVSGKRTKNAIDVFVEKAAKGISSLTEIASFSGSVEIMRGDSRALPLADSTVQLIVTSPPYANAIDYVRAHKFSLVWFGDRIDKLSTLRSHYIGAEKKSSGGRRIHSQTAEATMRQIGKSDGRRAAIVKRYFEEMTACLSEMYRVLQPARSAIVVVGPSTMRGVVVDTALILAEIGEAVGFRLVGVKERDIDRDRRLMPISRNSTQTGIEARMHSEQVIAFSKPV